VKSRSIRITLFVVTMTALTLTAVLISTAHTAQFRRDYRDALESRSVTIAQNLRETAYKNLLYFPFDSFPGMSNYLREVVRANEGIRYVYITNAQGSILYHSDESLVGASLEASIQEQLAFSNTQDRLTISVEGFYESAVPLVRAGETIGAVHIGVAQSILDTKTTQMLIQSFFILVFVLVVSGYFLYLLLNRNIAEPLANLTRTAQQLASGDLNHSVDVERNDEIGMLGHAFNQMTEKLRLLYDTLSGSEAHFRSLIENASDIITVHQEDGKIIYNSPSVERVLGYQPDEILGSNTFDLVHPDDASRLWALLREAVQDPSTATSIEFRIRHKDGRWRFMEATSRSLVEGDQTPNVVLNSRDISQRKQREREQEAIITVAAAMRAAPSRASMMSIVLEQLMMVLEAEGALLAMRDPKTNDIFIEQGYGAWGQTAGKPFPPGERISEQVIASEEPYICEDVLADSLARRLDFLNEVTAFACVPLFAQEQLLGILWIGGLKPFEPNEVRLLAAIGDIAANAIHRASLLEQAEKRLSQLDALRKIDTTITASFNVQLSLNAIMEQVHDQLKPHAGAVLLFKPYVQTLEYSAGFGFYNRAIQRSYLRMGEGYAGRAALERKSIYIPHLVEAEDSSRTRLLADEGFAAYFCVPLVAKGRVKGVLEIFHRSPFYADADWIDYLETLAGQTAIAIDNAELFDDLQRSNMELSLAYDTTLEGWSRALDLRDRETEGHTQRVTEMTERLARAIGIPDAERAHIRRGALLHDIGKMGVPDHILHKPGPLTDEEMQIMRQHPQYAYDMLSPIAFLRPAIHIPYGHHEKWDGSGYPRGLKGDQIHLAARLFAVVDVWDALRSNRPYRAAWPDEKVQEHIRSLAGTHFDPQVVEVFLREVTKS